MSHYHVHAGTIGSLPELNHVTTTLEDAIRVAKDEKEVWLSMDEEVRGDIERHHIYTYKDGMNYIEIVDCDDDCLEREELDESESSLGSVVLV